MGVNVSQPNTLTEHDRLMMRQLITKHEGVRLKPYMDTRGKWTIGIGRNLSDVGISRTEADLLFEADLDTTLIGLRLRVPVFNDLDAVRQRVLVDMAFNMGISGLLTFRLMIDALIAGDHAKAAEQMRSSDWAAQVSTRAYEDAAMMETGTDPVR